MTLAGEYFGERELNARLDISSAETLWEAVAGDRLTELLGIEGSRGRVPSVFYRGQPNADYGLSSSLYRLCRAEGADPVREAHMARAEQAILTEMRTQGVGRLMTDGELLMVLQHHGIPTRLIDVSTAPMEALFFAVDRDDSFDGRLFVIAPSPKEERGIDILALSAAHTLEWAGASRGSTRADSGWTTRVAVVEEAPLDPRMHAQRGKFLVGGLIKRYAGMRMLYEGSDLNADQWPEVTTLGIQFPKNQVATPAPAWGARGWTVRVRAEWKREIRARLDALSERINADTMYPPIDEVRRLALRVAKDSLVQN